MMKAKPFTAPKDKTTNPHEQVHGKGGVTNTAMRKYGAGVARLMNQRGSKKVPATNI